MEISILFIIAILFAPIIYRIYRRLDKVERGLENLNKQINNFTQK